MPVSRCQRPEVRGQFAPRQQPLSEGGEILWRIEAPYFVAGLVVRDGLVVEAAPILGRTLGKRWSAVRAMFVARGWHGDPGADPIK